MTLRTNYFELAPKAVEILMSQESYLAEQFSTSGTVTTLTWELVKLRVSQINQCAFCIDMHSKDLLNRGESLERIMGLAAWQDMPLYSETERLALGLAERLTTGKSVDDSFYKTVVQVLGEKEVVDITIATNAINSWNRIAKTFKPEVGSYKPQSVV